MIATINNTRIEAEYDEGDPSVGLYGGGWMLTAEFTDERGSYTVCTDVHRDQPVDRWPVCDLYHGHRPVDTLTPLTNVSDICPVRVLEALEQVWDKIEADECIESLREDVWGAQMWEDNLVGWEQRPENDPEVQQARQEIAAAQQWFNYAMEAYNREGWGDFEWEDQ